MGRGPDQRLQMTQDDHANVPALHRLHRNEDLMKSHSIPMAVHILTSTYYFSFVAGGRGNPWLAVLRAPPTNTTDTDQLNRLRTAGRPTGLIFTNDRCSLLYMNGCELSTFECRIHHAFDEESMAAPSTYRTVQGL